MGQTVPLNVSMSGSDLIVMTGELLALEDLSTLGYRISLVQKHTRNIIYSV
jgi:hypothetical protein